MKRIKNLSFVAALVLGAVVAFTQSSFTSAQTVKHTGTEYQFDGTLTSQMKSAGEYEVVSGSGPICDEANELPCTITVTGDLQTWLNAHTNAQILAAADQTRD